MSERVSGTGRGLFLAELLIACLIFALAAAICARIFAGSHVMTNDSINLSFAISTATSGAEAFKASDGDELLTAELLNAAFDGADSLSVFYDQQWNETDSVHWTYKMQIIWSLRENYLTTADVVILDSSLCEIYRLEVAA